MTAITRTPKFWKKAATWAFLYSSSDRSTDVTATRSSEP